MKVLHALNHFLPQQTAGTEIYTWALCNFLKQQGVSLRLIVPNYGEGNSLDYIYGDLSVHKYAESSIVDRSLVMGFRAADGLPNFISYLNKFKPDIVHFHELAGSNGISLLHFKAAKASGAKVIMTFHLAGYSCKTGTLLNKEKYMCDGLINLKKCSVCFLHTKGFKSMAPFIVGASDFLHKLSFDLSQCNHRLGTALSIVSQLSKQKINLHSLVSLCEKVVVISRWYQQNLLLNGIGKHKLHFISQGLPFKTDFYPLKEKESKHPLLLIFLGRINKFKGLHLLIEALMTLDSSLVKLSIFGNSDDMTYEAELRAKTNEMENVSWRGKLLQDDVVSTLHQHDILCLCSTFSEMSPLVIQEAFAARIPVLASNVYGNAEQIQHNHNGLLFHFNNVEDLRYQILRCINEPLLLYTLAKNIKAPRSFEEVGKEYYTLYKNLLN